MKQILSIEESRIPEEVLYLLNMKEEEFTLSGKKVQGATLAKRGNAVLITSPVRFKIYHEGRLFIRIIEGGGFFKWAKGEKTFSQGYYLVEEAEECEINGNSKFIYVKA